MQENPSNQGSTPQNQSSQQAKQTTISQPVQQPKEAKHGELLTPQQLLAFVPNSKTADGYQVKKGDEKFYHVEVEHVVYGRSVDGMAPPKLSNPHIAQMHAGDYRRFLEDNPRLGYKVWGVKHDPDVNVTAKIMKEMADAKENQKTTK